MTYPTLKRVESASHEQLARWYRFLPTAGSTESAVMHRIAERFADMGGWNPELSKRIGWGKP